MTTLSEGKFEFSVCWWSKSWQEKLSVFVSPRCKAPLAGTGPVSRGSAELHVIGWAQFFYHHFIVSEEITGWRKKILSVKVKVHPGERKGTKHTYTLVHTHTHRHTPTLVRPPTANTKCSHTYTHTPLISHCCTTNFTWIVEFDPLTSGWLYL